MNFPDPTKRKQLVSTEKADFILEEIMYGLNKEKPAIIGSQLKWANDEEVLAKKREQERLKLANQPDQLSQMQQDMLDIELKKQRQGQLEQEHQEKLRQLDKYKLDFAKKRNAPLAKEVGVSLLENPFLLSGANSEQVQKLDPTQTEQKLEKLQEKELAMTKVMARLPINEELYATMLGELKVVAQERSDVEKDYLEIRLKENPNEVLGEAEQDGRRKRIRVTSPV